MLRFKVDWCQSAPLHLAFDVKLKHKQITTHGGLNWQLMCCVSGSAVCHSPTDAALIKL